MHPLLQRIRTSFPRGLIMVVAAALSCAAGARADDRMVEKPTDPAAAAAAAKPDAKAEDKPDYKPFDEVTKGFTFIDGFFPLYYNPKTDQLLAVIPKAMIGQDFLMARSIAGGGMLTGYQFGHDLVRWEEFNKKLVLVEPDLRYIRDSKSTVEDVVGRTYTDTVLATTPIVTLRKDDPVIELDSIFKKDFGGLSRVFGGGQIDSSLCKWAKKKVFKDNDEIAVEAVFSTKPGEPADKAIIHYSISRLPKNDYKPREADDRIGYFLTARKDWAADHAASTIFKRYVHRWQLRKSDPAEAVSDVKPEDQIVFYIEKTVPVKYRRYVREGIEMWNPAFEKAGLRNAVQVRQQTDSAFADIDPEDVNYNFFRWIVSGRSFAMGPSRANPLTGQILDADIIMDDSMIRVWTGRYGNMLAKGPTAFDDPPLAAFLKANPEWRFNSFEDKFSPLASDTAQEKAAEEMEAFIKDHAPDGMCTYAAGVSHEMTLGAALMDAAAAAGLDIDRDEYVGQWVKLVACHEVGHTLGLRHNFKASAWKALNEITSNEDPNVPTTASVMDYNPAIHNQDHTKRKLYLSQVVGPYDELAIQYGYRVPTGDEKEPEMLAGIAKQLAEKGLDYATDDSASFFAPDPLVNTYDNSNDPLAWAAYQMDLVDGLRKDVADWAVKDGQGYDRVRRSLDMLLFEYGRVTQFTARLIGGQFMNRDHHGDPNERPPIVIVPARKQRDALEFLAKRVFGPDALSFPPELLNKLAPGRWGHWDSDAWDDEQEYPIHERIAAIQYWALFHVTNPVTVLRVYDEELKVPAGEDAFGVAEMLSSVSKSVWAEVQTAPNSSEFTARHPYINSVRRSLQRQYVRLLTRMVMSPEDGPYPADAISVARLTLSDLATHIDDALKAGKLDDFSKAHLQDARTRIGKALDASYEL